MQELVEQFKQIDEETGVQYIIGEQLRKAVTDRQEKTKLRTWLKNNNWLNVTWWPHKGVWIKIEPVATKTRVLQNTV